MLSALLNSIQATLGTRGFIVSSVFPVAMFAIANGLLATRVWPSAQDWITALDAGDKTLLATAGLAAVLVASYILSALASAILETFEGRHWPVTWLRGPLHRVQLAKLRDLERRYTDCVIDLDQVAVRIDGDRRARPVVHSWLDILAEARRAGQRHDPARCQYPRDGIAEMRPIRKRRESGREIAHDQLASAVVSLLPWLWANAADGAAPHGSPAWALDTDYDRLIEAMYYARDRYQAERIRLYNLRKFNYPVDAGARREQSSITLAPTALGNISRTMRSYAQNYYGFDLDVLWTRLQNVLRSSEPYFSNLQDAKVQLDFFAACAWLAWLTTFVWLAMELLVVRSVRGFIAVGIVGPLVAMASYALACRAYSVFADVMRTGVDLFRFKVLSELHLPLPAGLEEERIAWSHLANAMGYLNLESADGSAVSVTYKHGA